MKRTLLTLCLVSAACFGTYAGDYEDYLAKAESEKSLDKRMAFWLKAAESTKDEQKKLELYERGFDLAKKLNQQEQLNQFANLVRNSPVVTPERKASATFEYLMAQKNAWWFDPGISYKEYEYFLSMKGITPEQEQKVMMKLANTYHWQDLWYKEIELLHKVLNHPKTNEFQKQDTLINLSNVYLSMNDMDKSLECLQQMLKMKTLAPTRRAKAYMLMGDTILKGYGWYYRPSDEQYKELCGYYKKAMELKNGNAYNEALTKMVQATYDLKKFREVVNLSDKYITGNKKVNGTAWMKLKNLEGKSHLELEEFPEAVEIFEQLYKYKYQLADTCMALGESFYRNGDYSMALGMYDEAIVELGRDDSDRPAICKRWVGRLKWFSGGKAVLDKLYATRAKRLNDEAKAQGKGPVVDIKKKDLVNPLADTKKKAKKKPQTLQDLMKENEDDDGGGLFE